MPTHLKNRVRERMAKTGETWVTALRKVRAQEAAEAVSAPVAPRPRATEAHSGRPEEGPRAQSDGGARGSGKARLIFTTNGGEQAMNLGAMNSVGRSARSWIQLADKIVAKEHCLLERRAGAFVVRDLGSLNGTYVNGERVRGERALEHGDELGLGSTRARYDDGVQPRSVAPPQVSPGVILSPFASSWTPSGGRGDGGPGGAPAEIGLGVVERSSRPPERLPN